MGKIVCPKCEKDDQIQKVTSIRTGGVSTTNYGNVYGGRETAVSVTSLASRLSPPTNNYNMSSCGMWMFTSIFPWGIVTWILVGLFKMDFSIGLFVGAIVGIGGYFGLYLKAVSQQKAVGVTAQKKMQNYIELYYCFRDDCVFDPRTNKYTSPEGIDRLL